MSQLRAAISASMPDVIAAMVRRALAGDVGAAKLLLERVIPAVRPVDPLVPVETPAGATLTEQGRAVLEAAAQGHVPHAVAAQVLDGLVALARVSETDELKARIEALEAATRKVR